MGVTIDDSDFKKKALELVAKVKQKKQQAVRDVASEILRLSQEIVPIGTAEGRKNQGATLQNSGHVEDLDDESLVGYNTVYAAYQHEGMRADGTYVVRHYSNPRSQRKFLENPIKNNMVTWRNYFARMLQ